MRPVKIQGKAPHSEPCDLMALIIRVKYYLWNKAGRPGLDPHSWLCTYLADEKVKGKLSNWITFQQACRKIKGDAQIKVTLADVWRSLAIYLVTLRYPHITNPLT
jgi:hypothetical protein